MAIINNLTDAWNSVGTAFTAIRMNVTNTASAAGSKLIDLLVDGASKVSVDKAGNGVFAGGLTSTNLTGINTGDNAANTLYSGLAASKQDLLVSATNIKTVNSTSLLGPGNIVIAGGGGGAPGGSDPEMQFNLAGALAGANTIRAPLIPGTGNLADAAGRRLMIGAVGAATGLYHSPANYGSLVLTNEACTAFAGLNGSNFNASNYVAAQYEFQCGTSFYAVDTVWAAPHGTRVSSDGGYFFTNTVDARQAANVGIVRDAAGVIGVSLFAGGYGDFKAKNITATGVINYGQFTTAAAPTYVKGASYFDTTLNKLRIGGATAWESVTST